MYVMDAHTNLCDTYMCIDACNAWVRINSFDAYSVLSKLMCSRGILVTTIVSALGDTIAALLENLEYSSMHTYRISPKTFTTVILTI